MSEIMNHNEELFITQEEAGFLVDDDQKAEWCLDKIREATAEKEKWTAFYTERMNKICEKEDNRIQFFEMKLSKYFSMVPHKETKTQESYQLPSGKLVLKEQQPEYERDDTALMDWLNRNNMKQYIQVKESVDWSGLKKMFKDQKYGVIDGMLVSEDGEIVPGITVTDRPDVFKVEVK